MDEIKNLKASLENDVGVRLKRLKAQGCSCQDGDDMCVACQAEEMLDTLTNVSQRLSNLGRALEFYADPETYFAIGFFPDPPCGAFMEDFEEVEDMGGKAVRPGKRARSVLRGEIHVPYIYILYDGRACAGQDPSDAAVLVCCDSEAEAESYKGEFGSMACWRYDDNGEGSELVNPEWLWDWHP